MPSPVGHILTGAIVYLAGTKKERRSPMLLGVTLLGATIPDFDFLPGILIGKMGAFHHGVSHSLTFAILFGVLVFLFVRRVDKAIAVRTSMLAAVAYASHVGLDFIGVNEGTRGVPILWPLSDAKMGFGLNLFGHFRWGDVRDGLGTIIRWENVMPVAREFLILGSVVFLLFWRESALKPKGPSNSASKALASNRKFNQ
jgi:inner membrane protein